MQFIDLKQHFVNRLPSVQPLCLQYVAVTFHGAAQSVSMEACRVARCCTVRVSTSFRMLVHFTSFCVGTDWSMHRLKMKTNG
jgi:hypothetical protein